MKNPKELSTLTILMLARERIADPAHWCQRSLVTSADGLDVGLHDENAARWCAVGAVCHVFGSIHINQAIGYLHAAAKDLYRVVGIILVNDLCGHDATLRCFDRAIQMAAEAQMAAEEVPVECIA